MTETLQMLSYLAEKGALFEKIELSTVKIAVDLKSTQQTISRKLMQLEQEGFLERDASTRGIRILLTEKGRKELEEISLKLRKVFGERKKVLLGVVRSGLGEGAYYVSMKQYTEQFKKKLGFIPYPGTLNVKVNLQSFLQFVAGMEKIQIEGFTTQTRTFGGIDCFKVKVSGIESALIIPHRTSHDKSVAEVISPVYFRQRLKMKDNDEVEITHE